MYNRLLNSDSQNPKNLFGSFGMIIPLFLLFKSENSNINLGNINVEDRIEMMKNIKPYFYEKDQKILSKVQDVLEIIYKINRLTDGDYSEEVINTLSDMDRIQRKEKILKEISKYVKERDKKIINMVVDSKERIYETKANISGYKSKATQANANRAESMVDFIKCFKPVLDEKTNKQIRKIEKIIEIIKSDNI
ncbi:hypothetical protein SAMN02745135_00104 [Caloranaerobacter azorensis DSM 13643]|uniref:Uncharacterized protein n=1 Tax=Caloranaerobacter azorensis DSM 13643 TaxID=1121264 RepID=A0A1M5R8I4_9FIRM|nr:hypothetical protein [Caloranaerobacter azorensis]SHH22400.1 hypothetical protein SAMN02745135_00104 [Caloranaerobacter azorensis DSM 13643]